MSIHSNSGSSLASANARLPSLCEFLRPISALYPHVEAMQPSQLHKAVPEWYMEETGDAATYWASLADRSSEPESPSAASFSSQRSGSPSPHRRAMFKLRQALRSPCSNSSLRSTASQSPEPY
ncbi:hypothetical protein DTO027B5_7425 [Paecilomyces variotii]|nr:hypothetical protein DTO169E5_2320 [Paecilomyces variotii]KAJ9263280.1 hypothetical protein DTO195F2_2936 [Paecilomyces variotii]KAJ9285033.1 hypothetical protein DTO021C3_7422 [Paecilomyces variotii]KAJ9321367.1 hypothetical protein DTO027B3_7639 [Paecilomyces variotii]KAJ9330816.1 hypothetical protein DTO027B5_7425 [Paecilomyces variotii]